VGRGKGRLGAQRKHHGGGGRQRSERQEKRTKPAPSGFEGGDACIPPAKKIDAILITGKRSDQQKKKDVLGGGER